MEHESPEILNQKYLNNGYFYLTCNACDRLITKAEMTEDEYNANAGYCNDCKTEAV